jgi:hypothetical protein
MTSQFRVILPDIVALLDKEYQKEPDNPMLRALSGGFQNSVAEAVYLHAQGVVCFHTALGKQGSAEFTIEA